MSTNRYGVDVRYFRHALQILIRDLPNYRPDELARALKRIASAVPSTRPPQHLIDECSGEVQEYIQQLEGK